MLCLAGRLPAAQPMPFNLHFIRNLLVSARYSPQALIGPIIFQPLAALMKISYSISVWMKRGHLDSHKGWLCPVTSESAQVTMNSLGGKGWSHHSHT
jgi:hypothetical protein